MNQQYISDLTSGLRASGYLNCPLEQQERSIQAAMCAHHVIKRFFIIVPDNHPGYRPANFPVVRMKLNNTKLVPVENGYEYVYADGTRDFFFSWDVLQNRIAVLIENKKQLLTLRSVPAAEQAFFDYFMQYDRAARYCKWWHLFDEREHPSDHSEPSWE